MRIEPNLSLAITAIFSSVFVAYSEVTVTSYQNDSGSASPAFRFKDVPSPLKGDAAARASFSIVDGEADGNSGGLEKLHDGNLPREDDQPAENFFFKAGTDGGWLLVDLGNIIEIKQVNTYSWHNSDR